MRKPPGYWTKERITEAASTCKTRGEFGKKYPTAAIVARKMGWMDEICTHMEALNDPTVRIGIRYGYIVITGLVRAVDPNNNKYTYLCDCGNTGSFKTNTVRETKKFKKSCGCNNGGARDHLLLFESGFKKCFVCKQTLPISEFGNNKSRKNGLQNSCKQCKSKIDKSYRDDPRFRERLLDSRKTYYHTTIKENPERYDAMLKRLKENRDYAKEYSATRNNPIKRSKQAIRSLVLQALKSKGVSKSKTSKKTEEILGCDLNFFREHIESKFTEGMNWLNHGEWHLDHIIPMDAAETIDEVIKLNHWTNFQPLWSNDNYSKFFYILEEHHELFHKLLGREFDKEGRRVK